MPKLSITIPHELGKEQAADRLNKFIDGLHDDYGSQVSDLHQAWQDSSLDFGFRAFGMAVKGQIAVGEKQLDLKGDLPMAAMVLKGKIESAIRDELTKLLA